MSSSMPWYGRTNTSQARSVAAAESKNRTSTGAFPYAGIATPQAQLASVTGLRNSYAAKLGQAKGRSRRNSRSRRANRKTRRNRK